MSAYREALCERVEVNARRIADPDATLALSVTEAAPARSEAFGALGVEGVERRAEPRARDWLADLHLDQETQACVVLAALTLLRYWPEAEPPDLLADLSLHPPAGSTYLTINALVAMAETGREDYLDVIAGFIDPTRDARVVAKALRAAAVITGDADFALRIARDDTFPIDEGLAFGLAGSLDPAEGPALDATMQVLLRSSDPYRQEAGLRAAALGTAMPAALPDVLRAARDPDVSLAAARYAVDAIQRAMPGSAGPTLLQLARDDTASADASASALLAIADAPVSVAVAVTRRQPTPAIVIRLAAQAERMQSGGAEEVLRGFAATRAPLPPLIEAIRASDDELVWQAGRTVFDQPGLWD